MLRKRTIERRADAFRNRYGPNDAGLPVPVKRLAEAAGIEVRARRLSRNESGMYVQRGGRRVIFYHPEHSWVRMRFTIAHELGHAELHGGADAAFVDIDMVALRNDISSTGLDHREREANAFAAALLMPREFGSRGDS